jgi:hypothetical protein
MLRLLVILILIPVSFTAQWKPNELKNTRWYTSSLGLATADNGAIAGSVEIRKRSDLLATTYRAQYIHQISTLSDSCSSPANMLEFSALWGEGWAGKRLYAFVSAGMGLNWRSYCQGDDQNYARRTRMLVSVPAIVEGGFLLNDHWCISLRGIAGWNFLQPYAGGQIGICYRIKQRSSQETNTEE